MVKVEDRYIFLDNSGFRSYKHFSLSASLMRGDRLVACVRVVVILGSTNCNLQHVRSDPMQDRTFSCEDVVVRLEECATCSTVGRPIGGCSCEEAIDVPPAATRIAGPAVRPSTIHSWS